MKKLNRILFELNKQEFFDFAIEDLYGTIPKRASEPAITVLQEQRSKVQRWFMWQAFVLQRRLVNNPREAQMIMGMLLQIKICMQMLSGGDTSVEAAPDTSPAAKARAEREKAEQKALDDAMAGIEKFRKGGKDEPQE